MMNPKLNYDDDHDPLKAAIEAAVARQTALRPMTSQDPHAAGRKALTEMILLASCGRPVDATWRRFRYDADGTPAGVEYEELRGVRIATNPALLGSRPIPQEGTDD